MDILIENFKISIQQKQPEEATRLILKLSDFFDSEISENEYNPYVARILDRTDGLITFFVKMPLENFHSTLVTIFQLYKILIKNNPQSMSPYIEYIITVSMKCFSTYKRANVRESILIVLIEVFKNKYELTDDKIPFVTFLNVSNGVYTNRPISQRVVKQMGIFIGVLCKYHPGKLLGRYEDVGRFLMRKLKDSVKEQSDMPVFGYLQGLTNFMSTFSQYIKPSFCFFLYVELKNVLVSSKFNISTKKEAIILIKENGALLASEITKDEEYLKSKFDIFLEQIDRKMGVEALTVFYKALSTQLKNDSSPKNKELFLKYFNKFRQILTSEHPTQIQLRLAIRGFGYFAKACEIYLTPNDVLEMFRLILQKVEVYYLTEITDKSDENLEFLPDYIQSLSEIIINLKELTEDELIILKQMNILLIKTFPNLPIYYHNQALASFIQSLTILQSTENNNFYFDKFLTDVVYQGVIWTCSHTMAFEAEILMGTGVSGIITYKTFLPFWEELLKSEQFQSFIHSQLFKVLFTVAEKLDLNTTNTTTNDNQQSNIDSIYQENEKANNMTDFKIFINVVDFYCHILKYNLETVYFKQYAIEYFECLVCLSLKYPLISGFCKLISAGLDKLDRTTDLTKCALLLKNFFYQTLNTYMEYRDDLHIAILNMILSSPMFLLHENLHFLPPLLCCALDIGQTNLHIASKTIDALKVWMKDLTQDEITLLLTTVVPKLDKYLKTESNVGELDEYVLPKTKVGKKIINKKIVLKSDPELLKVQQKILIFLGTLDGNLRNLIVNNEKEEILSLCEIKRNLKYKVPFNSCESVIFLDEMLPRILELVLTSNNRKIRVHACECLHSIVIYLIGQHSQQTDMKTHSYIFQRLFSPLLELACDDDSVIQQLFEPLIKQIIHWITTRIQLQSDDSDVFLEILMESIIHPTNSKLRTFSAECLYEFSDWSMRQGGQDLINVQKILKRIITFAVNPSSPKRYGAALAFNHLFKILIRQSQIVSCFWLELMTSFLKSLSYRRAEGLNCNNQVIKALGKILIGFEQNSHIFNKYEAERFKPFEFKSVLLKDTVLWLFRQCGSKNLVYSQQCQLLFVKLCRYIDDTKINTPLKFTSNYIDDYGKNNFRKLIEPKASIPNSDASIQNLLDFSQQLQVSLNCHVWILNNKYVTIQKLFPNSTQVIDAVVFYVENIAFKKFEVEQSKEQYNLVKDSQELEKLKFQIISDTFNLFNIVLEQIDVPQLINNHCFQQLIVKYLFEPYQFGFVSQLNEQDLNKKLGKILWMVNKYIKDKHFFYSLINSHSQSTKEIMDKIKFLRKSNSVDLKDIFYIKGATLLKKIFKESLITNVNFPDNTQLVQCIYDNIVEIVEHQTYALNFSPTVLNYYNLILDYSWINYNFDKLVELLHNQCAILEPGTQLQTNYNFYFLKLFKKNLIEHVVRMSPKILIIESGNIASYFKFIQEIVDQLKSDQNAYLLSIIEFIADNWQETENYIGIDHFQRNKFLCLFKQILLNIKNPVYVLSNCNSRIYQWLLAQLTVEEENFGENMEIFDYQCKIVELLVSVTGPDDFENQRLRNGLNSLQQTYLEHIKVDNTSSNRLNYITIYKKLVELFKQTTSPTVLHFIIDLTLAHTGINYECEKECKEILENGIHWKMLNISNTDQLKIINFVYKTIKTCDYDAYKRLQITELFLITFMNFARKVTIENFLKEHLSELDNKIQNIESSDVTNDIMCENMRALIIIQYLYILPIDKLKQLVVSVLEYEALTDLNINIVGECFKISKIDNSNFDESTQKLYLRYVQVAYNTFAAVISNTQDNTEVFVPFLQFYSEWSKIIDCTINHHLEQMFNDFPAQKNKIILVRRAARQAKKNSITASQPNTISYLSTQNLFNSTLEPDMAAYDFSTTVLKNSNCIQKSPETTEASLINESHVTVNIDVFNDHPCMPTACALIAFICEHLTKPNDDESEPSLPEWIEELLHTIQSEDVHRNVKLFTLKLIVNNSEYCKPFAKWLVGPIMDAICSGVLDDYVNNFMVELVLLLTSWKITELTSDDRNKVVKFLDFFVPRCYHNTRADINKNCYLELMKNIVELWRPFINMSDNLIDYFHKMKDDKSEIIHQINISSFFIKNDINLWRNNFEKSRYCELILNYTKSSIKAVYCKSVEFIGLLLKTLDESGDLEPDFLKKVQSHVTTVKTDDIFFNKLHEIHKYYPKLIDRLIIEHLIDNMFKKAPPKALEIILDILIVTLPNCYDIVQIKNRDFIFEYSLNHDDLDVQQKAVNLLKAVSSKLENITFIKINHILDVFLSHRVINLRKITYLTLIDLYKRFKDSDDDRNILKIIKEKLLRGLVDNSEIQKELLAFWFQEMSTTSVYEFMVNLYDLYSPSGEKEFLGQYVWFVFELATLTEQYSNKIYDKPLRDCNYTQYKIILRWFEKNASLTPMFVETATLSTQDVASLQILATNRTNETSDYTNSNLETFSSLSSSSMVSGRQEDVVDGSSTIGATSTKVFLKSQGKMYKSYILSRYEKKVKESEIRKKRQKQKENEVQIYRKYRKGDFPDIEITNEEIIKPLQVLARYDPVLSKIVFVSIFNGLFENGHLEQINFIEKINTKKLFVNILEKTNLYLPNLIGAIFEIIFKYRSKIEVSPELISTASQRSGLLSFGCLVLEQYIIEDFGSDEPSVKRQAGQPTPEIDCWLKLAELYKNMSEYDYMYGIFGEKINDSQLREAFILEFNNNWSNAIKIYHQKIDSYTTDSIILQKFYHKSFLHCLEQMSNWEELNKNLSEIDESLWTEDWKREELLPWVIKTQIYNLCQNAESNEVFLQNLDNWLRNSEQKMYLEKNFSEYLILFAIWSDKFEKAKCFTSSYEKIFLDDWSDINSKHMSLKISKLESLEIFSDIKTFFNIFDNLNNFTTNYLNLIDELCNDWQMITSKNINSISMFERKLWYRNMFARKISGLLTSKNLPVQTIELKLNESLAHIALEFAHSALHNKKFALSAHYKRILDGQSISEKIKLQHSLLASKLFHLTNLNNEKVIRSLRAAAKVLDSNVYINYPELNIQSLIQKAELFIDIARVVKNDTSKFVQSSQPDTDVINKFMSSDELTISTEILNYFNQAESLCSSSLNNTVNQRNILIDIYIKMVSYCQSIEEKTDYHLKQMIQSLFRCMKLGSNKAVQLFPNLLLNFDKYSIEVQQCFEIESADVPVWMFLSWITQLLVALNKSGSKIFHNIILRIATTYPNAMRYAYHLSRQTYSVNNEENADILKRLDKLFMENDEIETFLQAIMNVNRPDAILLTYIKKFTKVLHKPAGSLETNLKILYKNFKIDLGDFSKSLYDVPLFGSVYHHYEVYAKEIDNLLISDKNPAQIYEALQRIKEKLEKHTGNDITRAKLKDYSPWLSNYDKMKLINEIEIPGQYSSDRKPQPQYHINIHSFKKHIQFMKSIRKPVKLVIVGSDAKEYPFLIKFGEDLRQDQRIEQLFTVINTFLLKSTNSLEKMTLITYQVIPLTDRYGMIQWLDNTIPLDDFVFTTTETKNIKYKMDVKYGQWLNKGVKAKLSLPELYARASICYKRNEVVAKYNELQNQLPWDLFRRAFMELSTSLENFFFIRHEFAKKYAVLSVAHWILGIGDRHLSNMLINTKNGQVIGIDFGCAFGIATQILPVPELVPFRLTPQILNILKPFNESGILKQSMLKTLQTVRSNKDILILLMNVFIEEPITDWLEEAVTKFDENANNDNDNFIWYLKKKVALARKKLHGANPAYITINELNDNKLKKKDGYIQAVKGDEKQDRRAQVANENLDVEVQLECLLNQATDPNLLGRMYIGWSPFV